MLLVLLLITQFFSFYIYIYIINKKPHQKKLWQHNIQNSKQYFCMFLLKIIYFQILYYNQVQRKQNFTISKFLIVSQTQEQVQCYTNLLQDLKFHRDGRAQKICQGRVHLQAKRAKIFGTYNNSVSFYNSVQFYIKLDQFLNNLKLGSEYRKRVKRKIKMFSMILQQIFLWIPQTHPSGAAEMRTSQVIFQNQKITNTRQIHAYFVKYCQIQTLVVQIGKLRTWNEYTYEFCDH
eukprot:TRINITY_DN12649_c1_g1_i1.p2 TRINITY_DN12649_c1_g1~~TRINITY_DN12649_c1_g1_i1.p2  ORF type:complete len:234 (+),score=-20.26 TRINITY_DN12649_c1_g1_i1:428-1129(+)